MRRRTAPEPGVLKILFVSHHGELGGAEMSLLELLREFRRSGIACLLACPASSPLACAAAQAGVQIFGLPMHRLHRRFQAADVLLFVPRWLLVTGRLLWIIRRQQVDIVHTNNTVSHVWTYVAARFSGRPVVWHWRDFYDHPRLNRFLSHGPGMCVSVSKSVHDFAARQMGSQQRLRLVRNGLPLQRPAPDPEGATRFREELGVQATDFLVAGVGQAVPRKGFDVLIRALAITCDAPRVRVVLACRCFDRESSRYLQSLMELGARLGCNADLRFIDPVYVDRLFLACDAVVIPSRSEPFGRVAVEAMAAGKPVVCTQVQGLEEIVAADRTGILVPVDNDRALCAALRRLAADRDLCERLGVAGRGRALQEFSIQRAAKEVLSVYADLLQTPPAVSNHG